MSTAASRYLLSQDSGEKGDDLLEALGRFDDKGGQLDTLEALSEIRPDLDLGTLKAFCRAEVFWSLKLPEKQALIKSLKHLHMKTNDVVCREGDIGDYFYVIKTGEVIIYFESEGPSNVLATRGVGDSFGEFSLLRNQPRSATVRCSQPCVLLRWDKEDFLRYAAANETEKLLVRCQFLESVSDFKRFSRNGLVALGRFLEDRSYLRGEMILERDETPVRYVYWILSGEVHLLSGKATKVKSGFKSPTLNTALVTSLHRGQAFGDWAALYGKPQPFYVMAASAVTIVTIDKNNFNRLPYDFLRKYKLGCLERYEYRMKRCGDSLQTLVDATNAYERRKSFGTALIGDIREKTVIKEREIAAKRAAKQSVGRYNAGEEGERKMCMPTLKHLSSKRALVVSHSPHIVEEVLNSATLTSQRCGTPLIRPGTSSPTTSTDTSRSASPYDDNPYARVIAGDTNPAPYYTPQQMARKRYESGGDGSSSTGMERVVRRRQIHGTATEIISPSSSRSPSRSPVPSEERESGGSAMALVARGRLMRASSGGEDVWRVLMPL